MKRGLHLGRKPARGGALLPLLLAALVLGAAFQGARLLAARRSAGALRTELSALRDREEVAAAPAPAGEIALLPRLRAVLAAGALEALPPTALLRMLEDALPEGVVVSGLSIKASPPGPSMTVEATSRGAGAVTELQRRMDASPLVRGTSVLDERRTPEGGLAVRLQVDLDPGGLP